MTETASGAPVVHLDVEQRARTGRAARAAVPRSAHAAWVPGPDRADPTALLTAQETTRVPDLVPLRHERMLASPFTFYRGAAVIMAADLATSPNSGLRVQACGDAHLSNFGGFAAPDRALTFDINDFDETNPGPFEWDVKRLAASFEIAARSLSFTTKETHGVVSRVTRAYREAMTTFSGMTNLDVWYARLDVEKIFAEYRSRATPAEIKRFEKNLAKAQGKDNMKAFTKLTELVDGEHRIKADPPVVVPLSDLVAGDELDELRMWLEDRIRVYRRTLQPDRRHLLESYRLVDFARKVVGVGSVGTRCWIALMLGSRRRRPAVPPGEGGRGVGARAVCRSERLRQSRTARRGGATSAPSGQRHPARLDTNHRESTASSATTTCVSCGTGSSRPRSKGCRRRRSTSTPACADGPSRGVTPVPVIASRSPPTWGPTTRSNGRWSSSAPSYADQNERDYATVAERAPGQRGARAGARRRGARAKLRNRVTRRVGARRRDERARPGCWR